MKKNRFLPRTEAAGNDENALGRNRWFRWLVPLHPHARRAAALHCTHAIVAFARAGCRAHLLEQAAVALAHNYHVHPRCRSGPQQDAAHARRRTPHAWPLDHTAVALAHAVVALVTARH